VSNSDQLLVMVAIMIVTVIFVEPKSSQELVLYASRSVILPFA